ncbi:MAG: hypothetical protein J5625_04245 [Lachnospiraceae bacterium]|nr:hypothetical protein [Lachnospiraceae bacterium]
MDNLLNVSKKYFSNKMNKICIVSVIEKEMEAIIQRYDLKSVEDENGEFYWQGSVIINEDEYKIDCFELPEKGNINSALYINKIIQKNYDLYFFVGTAGSNERKLYDVILVDGVLYLGQGAHTSKGTFYNADIKWIDRMLKNKLQCFALDCKKQYDKEEFNIKVAPVYSSNFVEMNPGDEAIQNVKKVFRSYEGVEMEYYGVLLAQEFNNSEKSFIMIRGISDKCDEKKKDKYEDDKYGLEADDRKIKAVENALIVLEHYCAFCNKEIM